MNHFRFLHWRVYKESKEFFKEVKNIYARLPKGEQIELGSQLIRSSFSVILNIAEGAGKSSDKELRRYLDIAIGSMTETIAGLDVFCENELINREEFEKLFKKGENITNQLEGFKFNLKKNPQYK